MLPVVPRIVNSVSCVKRIQHEIHFSWEAQYLVRLEGVACRSQETLSSSNTDVIFLGSIDIMSEGTRTSIMRQPWIN